MNRSSFIKRTASVFLLLAMVFIGHSVSLAQSQALNGKIEGTITDATGAAVPNATINIRNIETGAERQLTSDESGVYRAPLLPLGTYRVTVEAPNFKKLVREGITLTVGQIATVDISLQAGGVQETVTITSDAPIADPGKIDLGRVMNTREVQNLPLVSRNPYNYSLLQSNVTGRPNAEFGVPRINANGYARRTNYQLDGNNNTQADRGGIRLMPISDTFISEVQLVTNGFSAEFGNTPGLVMNAITPSGTNEVHGTAGYRLRRTPFYARPFQYSFPNDLPENNADNPTFAIGGPIIKDTWHYYGGYEYVKRDLAVEPGRLLSINAANQAQLVAAGLPSSIFPPAIPVSQKVHFFIIRSDIQIDEKHRLSGRFNYFKNDSPNNIGGAANTLQRSIDFLDLSYSGAAQIISTFSPNHLNEFRFQYAKRDSRFVRNENSGTGPSIVITGIASFGSPENPGAISPVETMTQFQNNFTWTKGNHTAKFGGGINNIFDQRRSNVFARYTFSSIAAYNQARTGANPLSYTNYVEAFGDPEIVYTSTFYNFFAQDDWKINQKLKLNYGVRYDLFKIPDANSASLFSASRDFNIDKNNFAPRVGIVYGLRDGTYATILRASAGIYYDNPFLDMYLRAIQNNGSPVYFNFSFNGNNNNTATASANAPAFPNTLGSLPPGSVFPVQSIETIAPDFENMYAMHTNVQLEQGLTKDISATVGFIHSRGRHIPIYRSINRINPASTLADGRPVFSNTISATTRLDPRFNNILMAESVGNSNYNAATFQLTKRFSAGYQFSVNYTLSKSEDNAPEQNLVATQVGNLVTSDPFDRSRDKGPSLADQRHTFVMSMVAKPEFKFDSKALSAIVNDNQIGVILTANSGERFNIVSTADMNLDGFTGSDRPVGITRNSGKTPRQFNVDFRYSRFFSFSERYKFEVFGEFVNIFNVNSIFQFNNLSVPTDAAGNVIGALPDFGAVSRGVTSLDSRQFQLGFKFKF